MDNQSEPKGLWERKTFASAVLSAVVAGALASSVCAVRGETLTIPHMPSGSVSQGHTDTLTAEGK